MMEAYYYPRDFLPFWYLAARCAVPRVARFLENLPSHAKRILDVGSGPGAFTILAARRGLEVTGCDVSLSGLREMRRAAERMAVSGSLTSVAGDACALPVSASSQDVVITMHVIEHIPEPRRMLEEALRVLKPGGRLLLGCPSKHHGMRLSLRLGYNPDPPDHVVLGYDERELREMAPAGMSVTRVYYQGRFLERNFCDLQEVLARMTELRAVPGGRRDISQASRWRRVLLSVAWLIKEAVLVPVILLCWIEDSILRSVPGSMVWMEARKLDSS